MVGVWNDVKENGVKDTETIDREIIKKEKCCRPQETLLYEGRKIIM